MTSDLYKRIEKLHKKHKVYFDGMHLPLEECAKPAVGDFIGLDADVAWTGYDYNERIGLFFFNIRDLESMLIYCVSECVLTFTKKTSIDYVDIANAMGIVKKQGEKRIDFQLWALLDYLKDKEKVDADFFNELDGPLTFFREIRNALFHANTVGSFQINIHNNKLYFNTSPTIDDIGVYAYVYEVNKDFFEVINMYLKATRYRLVKITNYINIPKTPK